MLYKICQNQGILTSFMKKQRGTNAPTIDVSNVMVPQPIIKPAHPANIELIVEAMIGS